MSNRWTWQNLANFSVLFLAFDSVFKSFQYQPGLDLFFSSVLTGFASGSVWWKCYSSCGGASKTLTRWKCSTTCSRRRERDLRCSERWWYWWWRWYCPQRLLALFLNHLKSVKFISFWWPLTRFCCNIESPFEFRALEVALEAICSFLAARTAELETAAYPALDELTSKVGYLIIYYHQWSKF